MPRTRKRPSVARTGSRAGGPDSGDDGASETADIGESITKGTLRYISLTPRPPHECIAVHASGTDGLANTLDRL
ncbi:hypothetical protein GCM10009680_70000 [Streptomyces yatensis]|uniref:Uncharacterized protein n=1 Tax=Streptomyces yatensis TaxID=155177 RepID=A0ABP4VAN8_9ACTN